MSHFLHAIQYLQAKSTVMFLMYSASHRYQISLITDKGKKNKIQSIGYLLLKKKKKCVGVGVGVEERVAP